ncbi:FecR family protein [Pedobacter borealis]|uniref:FecR family protein n=1 Tax=Pedobacter borealis TaxID=475254 RepID=UPI0004936025|nr:FecR family protein [Pedobacter borealis]
MINDYLQPEDFLMDDTFKKYCEGSDERCIRFWEKWVVDNPSKSDLVEKARYMYQVLSANITPLNIQVNKINGATQPEKQLLKRHIIWYGAAAACFLAVLMVGLFYYSSKPAPAVLYTRSFETGFGNKKKIILPDGTKVYLNSGSEIKMEKGFNVDTRSVKLIGEAYFDVAHNKEKPFKVLTDNFKVTVLGTVFNLKSYPEEDFSEASLIQGSIKVESNSGNDNVVTLRPGQKILFYKPASNLKGAVNALPQLPKVEMGHITKLDTTIVETAWVTNNLIFNAFTWREMEPMLERWYGVDIELGDETVAGYLYTATFSKENILEVLKRLQEVKHFNYKMEGGKIIITK